MIEMEANQVTQEILSLFDITGPTMPRAFNVLEGLNAGHILVDDPSEPTCAAVRDGVYGTLYFGGQVNALQVASLVQQFREIGEVGIGCWLDDPLNEWIPADRHYDGRTLYFTERMSNKDRQLSPLPAGYRLVARDEDWFRRSFDYDSTLQSFGTVENVLQHTLGFVVLHDDSLVCEAATSAPTHGLLEIGVTTAESYRGGGFAYMACARLIEACEEGGYKTWWDCAKQNIASTRLARKLRYQNEQEYRYVWWPKTNQVMNG
jgi:RimJ/RimL family protein N-acetyltransferase